ncbi:MAG: PQQ-dependent sugar dehydrogenase [Myxococcota bacterium]|nr:PQQ-dependent sugar dehydrogenase [Myxococcota bacterium]
MTKNFLSLVSLFLCLNSFEPRTAQAHIELLDITAAAFKQPVAARQHPSEPNVWYVAQRGGELIKWQPNSAQYNFLTLDKRLNSQRHGEAGLLGFDFDPQYPTQPYIYLSYTSGEKPFLSRISRMRCCTARGQLDQASEEIILEVEQPYGNHNGGHITFGPDGFLYIGLGDGGSGGDPKGNAQNRQSLLGNILRIDVRKKPYAIPADNPFIHTPYRPEIFAWGLRNPWRFHFDQLTGKLWAGDVGQNRREEIDVIQSGKNYGWNIMEGKECYKKKRCKKTGLTEPVAQYPQKRGDKSITGGYVYRGKAMKHLVGQYIFADFVSGRIFHFDPEKQLGINMLMQSSYHIASFAQDLNNELYILAYYQGKLLKLMPKK